MSYLKVFRGLIKTLQAALEVCKECPIDRTLATSVFAIEQNVFTFRFEEEWIKKELEVLNV